MDHHDWRPTLTTNDDRWPLSAGGPEPAVPSTTAVLAIGPVIARTDIGALCEQLIALLHRSGAAVVICDVGAITDPNAVTVDAVARLNLTALRLGRRMRLYRVCERLQDLLALTGLSDVVASHPGMSLEPWWQLEEREQALGVEERVDPGDPAG